MEIDQKRLQNYEIREDSPLYQATGTFVSMCVPESSPGKMKKRI